MPLVRIVVTIKITVRDNGFEGTIWFRCRTGLQGFQHSRRRIICAEAHKFLEIFGRSSAAYFAECYPAKHFPSGHYIAARDVLRRIRPTARQRIASPMRPQLEDARP